MKKALILLGASVTTISACSQHVKSGEVPSVVQNTVARLFASATNIDWEKKQGAFEAEFRIGKAEHTVYISDDGGLLMIKKEMPTDSLPAQVAATIKRDYADYSIDEVELLEKDGIQYYEVELEKKQAKDVEVVYTTAGTIATNISSKH